MNSFHTKRIRRFLALALAGSAAFVATTGAAQAGRSRCCSRTRRTSSSSRTAARCSTCPTRPRRASRSSPYFDVTGFKNDDFTFIKVGGSFPANTYVIEAGKNAFGQPLYVIPQEGGAWARR